MPHSDPVNWQPITEMPLIAGMIDGALHDTRDHLGTLTEARAKPHVLDDATIDRVKRVHDEQLEFVDIYAQQIQRWRAKTPRRIKPRNWSGWRNRTGNYGSLPRMSSCWPANCAKAPSTASST
jgi:hypothetical protein